MGLFEILFARVMAIVAAALAIMVVMSQLNQQHAVYRAWRTDIQQEAMWTAKAMGFAEMRDRHDPPGWEESLRENWRASHEAVRLTVRDERQNIIFDSHPGAEPPTRHSTTHLTGAATIPRPEGNWELLLSRPRPPARFMTVEIILAAALSAALAALLLFQQTNHFSKALSAIGAHVLGIAEGRLGSSLEVKGPREFKRLALAFNTMSARLHSEQARREQLIADVSHELRSPLGRLRALGETMARNPDEVRPLLTQTEEEIKLLERLISDLLDAARLEEQRDYIRLERVSLCEWWRHAIDRLSSGASAKGVRLTASGPELDTLVLIDTQRLLQALGNIVENGVIASSGRSDATVDVRLDIQPSQWTLEVTDRGRGIPAEAIPYIFDRFYRVEQDRGRATGGAGLGLTIARAIVEAHGGSISVESTPGQGASVTLRFPLPSLDRPATDTTTSRTHKDSELSV